VIGEATNGEEVVCYMINFLRTSCFWTFGCR
jgi:hypothetical protein